MKETIVFALSSNLNMVNEICNYLQLKPGEISVKHFADGECLVEPGETVRGKKVYVIQSTCKPTNDRLMELLICIDALHRASAREITVIIPYYGYARQDRKAAPRQPITSKLVASLLETAGADRVVTVELHASQIQGFFTVPVDDLNVTPMLAKHIKNSGIDLENCVVVSPDHGGVTRARRLADILNTPIAIIDKRRPRPNEVEAMNIIGDVSGKNCLVVDDICDTGGSLVACCEMLKKNGAKEIDTCIVHGVFSGEALTRIQNSCINRMIVTNTIELSDEQKALCPKLEIISVAQMLAKLIESISTHKPLSAIYAEYSNQ